MPPSRLSVWCARHWQPYFDGRANGERATRLLTSAYFNTVNTISPSPAEFAQHVAQLQGSGTPICCLLDEDDHDKLVMDAGPPDPDRESVPAAKITIQPRYQEEAGKDPTKP